MIDVDRLLCLVPRASAPPAALRQALHLAGTLQAALHVMPGVVSSEDEALNGEALEAMLDQLVAEETGGADRAILASDDPVSLRDVDAYVAETDMDLVVASTPPDRDPIPPLADRPTRSLIEQLDCPVFAVGPVATPASIRRILVPTDLSDHSLKALTHAVELARWYDASVDVLHVIDTIPYVALTSRDRLSLSPQSLPEHRARRGIEAFLRRGPSTDVPIHSHLAHGDPSSEIDRFAETHDVDLLVLSSHGRRTHPHRPLGQVADRVLGRVARPLFLVQAFGRPLDSFSSDPESTSPSSSERGGASF